MKKMSEQEMFEKVRQLKNEIEAGDKSKERELIELQMILVDKGYDIEVYEVQNEF